MFTYLFRRPGPIRVIDADTKVLTSDQYFVKGFGHVLEYPDATVPSPPGLVSDIVAPAKSSGMSLLVRAFSTSPSYAATFTPHAAAWSMKCW